MDQSRCRYGEGGMGVRLVKAYQDSAEVRIYKLLQ
jgi:hypothetical protein